MKSSLMLLLSFVLGFTTISMAQADKVLTKSIAVGQTKEIFVDLPGVVQAEVWDENYIRVTTYVSAPGLTESILQRLYMVGRYSIQAEMSNEADVWIISMPKAAHTITVKGQDVIEHLQFKIQYPKEKQLIVVPLLKSSTATVHF